MHTEQRRSADHDQQLTAAPVRPDAEALPADALPGAAALEESLDRLVPQRSAGAAYLPHRGRIMYCASTTLSFHPFGDGARTRGIASGLRAAGAELFVMGRPGYPWDAPDVRETPALRRRHAERIEGIEYIHRPEGDAATLPIDHQVQVAADALVREARLQRPSIMHAVSEVLVGLPALIAARRLGLPFVCEVRGLTADDGGGAWAARMGAFIAAEADAVLAISRVIQEELIRRGVPAERIRLLPQGTDVEALLPLPKDASFAASLGLSTAVPVIGFAGPFSASEDLLLLLQAANILRGRSVRFQLVLAGDGETRSQLEGYAERGRFGSMVRLLGPQPPQELTRFLSCIDIVACPGRPEGSDGSVPPLPALEACAASTPIVLSDAPAHRELVGKDPECGLLVEPGSPKALADALQRLIEDPELRTDLGRAGRLRSVDEHHWTDLCRAAREAHASAEATHRGLAAAGMAVSDLRIGAIAGERTLRSLRHAAQVVVLGPETAPGQLAEHRLDAVLLEAAGFEEQTPLDAADPEDPGEHDPEAERTAQDEAAAGLLRACRAVGIPTVLRVDQPTGRIEHLRRSAALADHVLTPEADLIAEHLRVAQDQEDGILLTVSTCSEAADPSADHPLARGCAVEESIAFAGAFGDLEHPERAQQLERLLAAARDAADGELVVYDEHRDAPDVLQRFPRSLAREVRRPASQEGGSAHLAHLSVSDAPESSTRLPRGLLEIAASGDPVLSAWSRGVAETFGDCLPVSDDDVDQRALLSAWVHDPSERLAEAWRQLRRVLRSHTIQTELILLARTAGISVEGLRLPGWACELSPQNADLVLGQSVLPRAVRVAAGQSRLLAAAQVRGIATITETGALPVDVGWWAELPTQVSRTWAEDLLWAARWGDWSSIGARSWRVGSGIGRVVLPTGAEAGLPAPAGAGRLVRTPEQGVSSSECRGSGGALTVEMPHPAEPLESQPRAEQSAPADAVTQITGPVLIAGHDLKFARSWIEHLEAAGIEVLLDEWANHVEHDEPRSLALLARAETVFCEWGLGNAVWYSRMVRRGQRLVVRVHAQELTQPHLQRIQHEAVDQYIFVGELMRDAAVRSHGVPRDRTRVVPNIVRAAQLRLPKDPSAEFTLGLVGIVPQLKRLDRAVTAIETLASHDPRWSLRVKGKRPEEYSWMRQRKAQMRWYRGCFRRIEELHASMGREIVTFDPHGDDMPAWFQGIGYAVSVSDRESFHLTLPDGAASGAAPISLAWPGSDRIYPREWLVSSVDALVERALALQADTAAREGLIQRSQEFVAEHLDQAVVHELLDRSLLGEHDTPGDPSPLRGSR